MSIQNISTTIQDISKIFKVDFKFDHSYSGYDYYKAAVKNTMPHLFKSVHMEVEYNPKNQTGQVSYKYTHPSGGQNGYAAGFIRNNKFTI